MAHLFYDNNNTDSCKTYETQATLFIYHLANNLIGYMLKSTNRGQKQTKYKPCSSHTSSDEPKCVFNLATYDGRRIRKQQHKTLKGATQLTITSTYYT